jgi:leucyl aminopeptidase
VVAGVFERRRLSAPAASLDRAAKGYLAGVLRNGDMDGKAGTTLLLQKVPGIAAERVLLVGLGTQDKFREKQYRDALAAAFRALSGTGAEDAALYLGEVAVGRRDAAWKAAHAALVARESTYRFTRMKSGGEDTTPALKRLALATADRAAARRAATGLAHGRAVAQGMELAKDLGNLPPNICTPSYLADQAREVAKRYRMKVTVLERADMERLGMHTLLSVAQGSVQPPKFIVLEHRGGPAKTKPVALVGKGITSIPAASRSSPPPRWTR